MKAKWFRCGRPAFATLAIEATIGTTRLEVSNGAQQTAMCSLCVLELADCFNPGEIAAEKLSRFTGFGVYGDGHAVHEGAGSDPLKLRTKRRADENLRGSEACGRNPS